MDFFSQGFWNVETKLRSNTWNSAVHVDHSNKTKRNKAAKDPVLTMCSCRDRCCWLFNSVALELHKALMECHYEIFIFRVWFRFLSAFISPGELSRWVHILVRKPEIRKDDRGNGGMSEQESTGKVTSVMQFRWIICPVIKQMIIVMLVYFRSCNHNVCW